MELLASLLQPQVLCLVMFVTACGFLIAGFPVAFTLAGTALIFALIGEAAGVFDVSLLFAFPQRIYAVMSNDVLVAVPLFIFMGVTLERSKIAEELLDNMARLFGSVRGGLAVSVSIVGALMAASTGIVGATVVTMGLLSLPIMLRRGYDPALACGSICASGTLGQIIPPSIVLVLLGDQLSTAYANAQYKQGIFSPDSVSVGDLFAGALFPGFVLVSMYIVYQLMVAWLRPSSSPPVPRDDLEIAEGQSFALRVLASLLPPIVLIIAVLGSILGGIATPTEAAGVGAVGAVLLAGYRLDPKRARPIYLAGASLVIMLIITVFVDLRMQREEIPTGDLIAIIACVILSLVLVWGIVVGFTRIHHAKVLRSVMQSTMNITSMVFVILIGASLFSLTFRGFGGDEIVHDFLTSLPGGAVGAVLVVMLLMFFLGFFLDFLEIIFIVVPIVAPILLQMELAPGVLMSPVWLGVMMGVNLQTSFLTPPFGFALFYLRGVAPETIKTSQIYLGVAPYIVIQLIALVVLWYLPELATWLPTLIFGP
ncbi:MAG: TRAP transporter large permease subunit [Acidiferrobacterales bacterium]